MAIDRFRRAACTLAAAAALASAGSALAQAWPAKPIKVISPFTSGSSTDLIARPILQKISDALKQPVVLESKPGANGIIGQDFVAKSAPDGYTLLISHVGPTAISPAMQAMPYDSTKDFAPITQFVSGPLILVVPVDAPYKTIRDIVDAGKAAPGKLSYGSVGPGSTTHLAGAMLGLRGGADLLHVPYKGGAPVLVDLLGKRISMAFLSIAAGAIPHIEAGKLRPIAVTTLRRSGLYPDVPTVAETMPGFEVNSWYGFMAPPGTPKEIVNRLNTEAVAALKSPEVIQVLKTAGLDVEGTSPEAFAQKIRDDLASWKAFIRESGIKSN